MSRGWESLGRAGYRMTVYMVARRWLWAAGQMAVPDADAVQSALDLATANFALDRDELRLLGTALRTSVGLEMGAE